MKKTLLALAIAAAAVSAQADVKISGFVSAQVQDNKDVDDTVYNHNGFSQSRFRIDSSQKWNDLTVGTNMEFGLSATGGSLNVRRNSLYIKGDFGTFRLGHHNDVGDGILNVGSAGTWTTNALTDLSFTTGVNSLVNGFDPGRSQGLRYYSPKIAGVLTIAGQLQNDGGSELALRLNSNGFKLGYYTENGGADNDDNSGYVIGYKAPFGLSLSMVHSERDFNTQSTAYTIVNTTTDVLNLKDTTDEHDAFKIGYEMGKHKFSVSKSERSKEGGDLTLDATGFGYEFSATKGVLLYASYVKTDNLEDAGVEEEDDTAFAIGGIVKF